MYNQSAGSENVAGTRNILMCMRISFFVPKTLRETNLFFSLSAKNTEETD